MVHVRIPTYPPNEEWLSAAVAANPGAVWLVGNEPDVIYQDNATPEEYAVRYHEIYGFLKARDPSARVFAGGIVQATPLRLEYLDRVLAAYTNTYHTALPADGWQIHEQILQEKRNDWGCDIPPGFDSVSEGEPYTMQDNANPAILQKHVVDFRDWMWANGYRSKPLYIAEYGVLMPSCFLHDEAGCAPGSMNASVAGTLAVTSFMTRTFTYLLSATDPARGYPEDGNRLVQRWLWYSLNDKPFDCYGGSCDPGGPGTYEGFNGGLFSYTSTQITQFGTAYGSFTAGLVGQCRLFLPLVMRNH
jgi:hypothetical protein